MTYARVGETTILHDGEYVVMATYKDERVDPFVKHRGSYDECAAYAERNESPDNPETYFVAEETPEAERCSVCGQADNCGDCNHYGTPFYEGAPDA